MKKYSSLLLLLLVVFFHSCEDANNIDPKNQLIDSKAIQNTDDMELAVRGLYSAMAPQNQVYFTSLVTDEVVVGNTSNGAGLSTHRYNITSTDGAASAIWANQYAVINRLNRILELAEINIVPKDAADQVKLDNLKGECYGIRALAHFELFSYYSPSYTNDAALSVPYIDYVVIFQKPGRNTVGEVAAGINADIASAESLLSDTFVKNRMSKAAVTALKAKFNLFRGNYDAAIAAVDDLDGTFALSTADAYNNMFLVNDTSDNDESIFELTRSSSADAAIGRIFINNTPGSTNFNMSQTLFNALSAANDIRLIVDIDDRSTLPDDIQIGKYRGSSSFNYINNYKYFRLSDMYLIRAEANLRKAAPNLPAAQADLQDIVTARDISGAPATVTVTSAANGLTQVLEQRRIELAFEASRFTDLKRYGLGVDRSVGGTTDCDGSLTPCLLPSTDYRFTLPIPEAELLANPTIAAQQNTGY